MPSNNFTPRGTKLLKKKVTIKFVGNMSITMFALKH
jgi:hypothetical protein